MLMFCDLGISSHLFPIYTFFYYVFFQKEASKETEKRSRQQRTAVKLRQPDLQTSGAIAE